MLVTTTNTVEGKQTKRCHGVAVCEVIDLEQSVRKAP